MAKKKDQRLQELAALSQLYSSLQGPQVRQQEGQQQNALAILGLMMQGEHQKKALGEQTANRVGDEKYRVDTLTETRAFGERDIQKEFIRQLVSDPNTPMEQKMAAIEKLNPALGPAVGAMRESGLNTAAQKAAPAFQQQYQGNARNLPELNKGIENLRLALPAEVFNRQDWTGLNSSLPASGATNDSYGSPLLESEVPADLLPMFKQKQQVDAATLLKKQQVDAQEAERIKRQRALLKINGYDYSAMSAF